MFYSTSVNHLLPELNREPAVISDPLTLQAEVESMRVQLDVTTTQLALERELAMDIHRTRSLAITESSALSLVFGIDGEDTVKSKSAISTDDILSSAFGKVSSRSLPEGFADVVAKHLRTMNHPDVGGDIQVSQNIAQSLANLKEDPTFSIATALLAAPKQAADDLRAQRIERYRLHIALAGANLQFDSAEEAKSHADAEIRGAEWRVRTQAAFKSFELIIGDNDTWNQFLREIVQTRHMHLINMVNRLQPTILSLQERLAKGDPVTLGPLDIATIDAVFERIWSTIGNKDSSIPYSPPYQNWLEELLPAIKLLDPGRKQGEEYTDFEPPIQITYAPAPRRDYGEDQKLRKDSFDGSQYGRSYNNYYDKYE